MQQIHFDICFDISGETLSIRDLKLQTGGEQKMLDTGDKDNQQQNVLKLT